MSVTHPDLDMWDAAAFAIATPEKGAFGHVTKYGDPDMTGRGGTSASRTTGRANLTVANFEPAIGPPRAFNARERRVAALPCDGKGGAVGRLQDGDEHCFHGQAESVENPLHRIRG